MIILIVLYQSQIQYIAKLNNLQREKKLYVINYSYLGMLNEISKL